MEKKERKEKRNKKKKWNCDKMRKIITMIFICILLLSIYPFHIPTVKGANWLSDYSHRQKHDISGSVGAGMDYPIFINISSGSGTSSGDTCFLDNDCQNFPYDIAFTDNDGDTELDYFIENLSSDPIRVWIEVADDLDSAQSIYIYYGKAGITTSNSNGTATFHWFYDWRENYDPANLTSSASAGDRWIHVHNSSMFSAGDNLTITDRSYNGTHTIPITYAETRGSSENISILTINQANNSFRTTTGLTREYNATDGHYATVSHWYRHAVYDTTPGKTFRWYIENTTRPSLTDFRSLTMQELGTRYSAPDSQATISIGVCEILNLDEESGSAPSVDSIWLRHDTKGATQSNATATTVGLRSYSVNDGIENEPDIELIYQGGANHFSTGFPYVTDIRVDGSQNICIFDMYNSTTGELNKTITQTSEFPNEALAYPFLRTHGGAGATHEYEFRYNKTQGALQIYNNKIGDTPEIDLWVYWWAIGKFISPEPAHSTWYSPENRPAGGGGSTGWGYYIHYRIDSDYIQTDLVDFPVLVVINSTVGAFCDNGDSIRFWLLDNTTELDYEIELWDNTGDSYVWVNITRIENHVDTSFLMFYNNSGVPNNQNKQNVWDTNFMAIYHMNSTFDSTSNARHLTDYNTGDTSGKIGRSRSFNAWNNEYIDRTTFYDFDNSDEATIEVWLWHDGYPDTNSRYTGVHLQDNGANPYGISLRGKTKSDKKIQSIVRNSVNNVLKESAETLDTWIYWVGTYNTTEANLFSNTTFTGQDTGTTDWGEFNTTRIRIGRNEYEGQTYHGYMDEIRISNVMRNWSWINASFHTQNQTIGFMSTSSPVVIPTDVPDPPTAFTAATLSVDTIRLDWTVGINATHTIVRRSYSSYPTTVFSGTLVCNSTGTTYTDTALTNNVRIYYRAWSYNSTTGNYSFSYASDWNHTGPANPTNAGGNVAGGDDVNISWIMGRDANRTLIIRNSNTYPENRTDGTEIYNGTGTYYVDTGFLQEHRYTLFSWNGTVNIYSEGVQLLWGALGLNCFNESNSSQAIEFDIEISNKNGSQVYTAEDLQNTHWVNLSDIPFGVDTMFFVSNASYQSRIYYYNLVQNQLYNYTFYLAPIEQPPPGGSPPGTENVTSRLYTLRVIDEYLYPIADANVTIKRELGGGEYTTVAKLITNGYGEANVWLLPGTHYKVKIEATGFFTNTYDWTTDPEDYGEEFPEIFRMNATAPHIEVRTFWDIVTFNATTYANNSIRVIFIDMDGLTTNAQFYTYELFKTFANLTATNTTISSTYTFWIRNVNRSRQHRITIHLNHTDLGYEIITILARPYQDTKWDADVIEETIEDVGGEYTLEYVKMFLVFLPAIALLVIPGKDHPGLATVISGCWMGFLGAGLGIPTNAWIIAPFIITIGIVLTLIKGGILKL